MLEADKKIRLTQERLHVLAGRNIDRGGDFREAIGEVGLGQSEAAADGKIFSEQLVRIDAQ